MSERPVIVAIDGPAGAGKSTVARTLAARLGYTLVDTGAIYRAVALAALRRGIPWSDERRLGELVRGLDLQFTLEGDTNRVVLEGEDVTWAIRTAEISMGASAVSALPAVRQGLLELQRRLALGTGAPGAVLEGRDIGTVVFPDAAHKFFLDAGAEERARRRWQEMQDKGDEVSFEEVLEDQRRRDARDQERTVAPLKPAEDAVVVDSTRRSADEVVDFMVARVTGRL